MGSSNASVGYSTFSSSASLAPSTVSYEVSTAVIQEDEQSCSGFTQGISLSTPLYLYPTLAKESEMSLQYRPLEPNSSFSNAVIPLTAENLASPALGVLLPRPTVLTTTDILKTAADLRDAQERIALGPSTFVEADNGHSLGDPTCILPSICGYTVHDVMEGWVWF